MIFIVTLVITASIKFLIPESFQLIYASILATITSLFALYERAILQKSIPAWLIFFGLPLVLASGSIVFWIFGFPYNKLGLWMDFAYWDSLLLLTLLIFFDLLQKKIIK
jgi:hypothetical protein